MLKLDNKFLDELGLSELPSDEKKKMLAHIYETLELRVGTKLAERMTDAQLDEFEKLAEANDEQASLQWLEANAPNYREVVMSQLEALKEEIRVALSAGVFIPTASPEDYEVSIAGKGKVLELSFWGNTRSKKDALVLLKDMTKWMDSKIRT